MSKIVKNEQNEEFRFIESENVEQYVDNLKKKPDAHVVRAEKSGAVIAKQVVEPGGRDITVWTANGNREAQEHVEQGQWILTRADIVTGKPVIDANGHANSWGVKDEVFKKKYDAANIGDDGFVKPKGGEQTFVQIKEDIAIDKPWGPNGSMVTQYLKAGSYLNVTNPSDVYGIAEEEFKETYREIDPPAEPRLKRSDLYSIPEPERSESYSVEDEPDDSESVDGPSMF